MILKTAFLKQETISQFKKLLPIISIVYLPFLFIFIIIRLQKAVPIGNLTRDPVSILNHPFYLGFLSQIGILFWCSCVSICFFCAALTKRTTQTKLSLFLLASGTLTAILLIDDLFLIHEVVFPNIVRIAISPFLIERVDSPNYLRIIAEKVFILLEALLVVLYLFRFRKIIQNTEFLLLILAFGFFGVSIFVDRGLIAIPQAWLENEGEYLLEDGAKLLGIVSWLTYFTRVCITEIEKQFGISKQVLVNQRSRGDR